MFLEEGKSISFPLLKMGSQTAFPKGLGKKTNIPKGRRG